MQWVIDPSSGVPLYEQLAASVRSEMAAGRVGAGARLPAAKDVAQSLSINLHTVLRAYQELRDEGLVDLRRGRGAVVTSAEPAGRARVQSLVRELTAEARRLGLGHEDLTLLITKEMS